MRLYISESKEASPMNKQITFGLIATAVALSTAAFVPTEAQANDHERRLNQLAVQMYLNNQAIAAQQQYWNYNNPYYYNSPYNYGYYNGYGRHRHWNDNWRYRYHNDRRALNTAARILDRVF